VKRVWTEERVKRLQREGRGEGEGANYKPWIRHTRSGAPMSGTLRTPGYKTGRDHHILSGGEEKLFFVLEFSPPVVDIREQFPLNRDTTLGVAQAEGLPHGTYPGTDIPIVMTIDFMVTFRDPKRYAAFSVKWAPDLDRLSVLEGLELERRSCKAMNLPYYLVVHQEIDDRMVKNLRELHSCAPKARDDESQVEQLEIVADRIEEALANERPRVPLSAYCSDFDERHSLEPGSSLTAAKYLMWQRRVLFDMRIDEVSQLCVAELKMGQMRAPRSLQAVG